ncbi:ABC transporter permease [Arthrobacter rhombi]|uniref:ABC transporter permease n=1 Tax=Arthrobacter rhombi TaxID=71253 RepID=UPI003FCF597D
MQNSPVTYAEKAEPGRFRRWYSSLHPSLQLIGMQLYMPLFFIIMFSLCYIAAFNHIAPHDIPVAVNGPTASIQKIADEAVPGGVEYLHYDDAASVREAVVTGEVGAGFDTETHTILLAGAHQAQASAILPELLSPLLGAPDNPPAVEDLAPLPAGDVGMTPMYLMLVMCIAGYLTAMFIGMMGGPLRHKTRLSVIVGLALVLSLLIDVLVVPVLGAISGEFFLPLWGLMWAWIVAAGLAVNGLSYFFGRFITMPALTIFVFVSIPASGAAFPEWLMPQPFRALNPFVVGSGITEMLKRMIYDVGPGYWRGWIMLVAYAGIGLLLAWVGKRRWENKRVHNITTGATTMFGDAQAANRTFMIAERDEVLSRHGLESTETGTIMVVDHPGASRADWNPDDDAQRRGGGPDPTPTDPSFDSGPSGLESDFSSLPRPPKHRE